MIDEADVRILTGTGKDIVSCVALHHDDVRLLHFVPGPQEYAGDGLRTLALAYKDLDEKYMVEWRRRHHEASISMDRREEKLDELYEEIERDLLVGPTALSPLS